MKVDATIVVAVVAFLGSVVSVVLTNRYAARSARAAQESVERQRAAQVDVDSFRRARENYDAALAEQERRIARLNHEMEEDRVEYRAEVEECKRRIRALQTDLSSLSTWARNLLRSARAAGVPVADPPVYLDDTRPSEGTR